MTESATIRVLIADDHPVVRNGLRATLEAAGGMAVVAEAADGREAAELFARERPDVAVLDLYMPVVDGLGAIEAIRRVDPDARLVILTTYGGDEDIYRGLRGGAKGYVLKDAPAGEIVESVRAASRGERYLPRAVAGKLAERMGADDLTPREREVLALLAEGLANKEIAAKLGISEGTVKAHSNSLFGKLGVQSRTEAATVAIRRGLVRLP